MAKKAIVMGATSGIGMEVAKLLAAKGWQVGIAGRRIERLQTLISDNKTTLQSGGTISDNKATPQGGIICYQQIDVTSAEAPSQLLELIDKLGGMDLYFHSSGIGWQNNSLDIEKELKTVETNGLGFTRMVDTAFNWCCPSLFSHQTIPEPLSRMPYPTGKNAPSPYLHHRHQTRICKDRPHSRQYLSTPAPTRRCSQAHRSCHRKRKRSESH